MLAGASAKFAPIHSSLDKTIHIGTNPFPIGIYEQHCKKQTIQNPAIFITATPKLAWEKIIDAIIPLWIHEVFSFGKVKHTVILPNWKDDLVPSLQPILDSTPITENTSFCFRDAVVATSTGSIPYVANSSKYISMSKGEIVQKHLESLFLLRQDIIASLASKYTNRNMVSRKIVLDGSARFVKNQLMRMFPNTEIDIISDTDDVRLIAETVRQAEIFVASDPRSMAYSIFLSPNASIVEVPADGAECLDASSMWGRITGAKHVVVGRSQMCRHDTIASWVDALNDGNLRFKQPSDSSLGEAFVDVSQS